MPESLRSSAVVSRVIGAVGMRGSLRKAAVAARGVKAKFKEPSDLAESVARSFGGAVEDRFIQARLPGIHRRVFKAVRQSKQSKQPEPRRGFDALVEALLPTITATEETDVEREIARAIGAGADDRVVHVLAVRILALRKTD